MGPVFDKYLFLLGSGLSRGPTLFPVNRANSLVGVAESVSGITSLVAAVPVGLVVDRHPQQRSRLLRWSTIMALLAMVLGFVVLITDEVVVLFASQLHSTSLCPVFVCVVFVFVWCENGQDALERYSMIQYIYISYIEKNTVDPWNKNC